jgi:hypothetical protein
MSRLGLIPLIVVVVATRLALAAQQQPGPAFEVVSIKPSQSTADGTIIRPQPDGRFVADNITVLNLIQQAYDVFAFQIVGAPSWLDRERFDRHSERRRQLRDCEEQDRPAASAGC